LGKRLVQASPAATVTRQREWLGNLRQVLIAAIRHDLTKRTMGVQGARSRLLQQSPALRVQRSLSRVTQLRRQLTAAGTKPLERARQRLNLTSRGLESVSPLATLDRGYAIVTDAKTGGTLTDANAVQPGADIHARLATGALAARVTARLAEDDHEKD
jgi:exodeoxyribonuclease VII large subunit